MFTEKAVTKEVMITVTIPIIKIFFLPNKSAQRPKIKTNIALAIKYAMGIQLTTTASRKKCLLIVERATFVADSMMGVENALRTTIKRTSDCFEIIVLLEEGTVTI
jgi:hypothetical protein